MALYGELTDGRDLKIYENTDELSTDFADYIAELSEAFVKERGAFTIALSGGSLISLMGKLCEAPYNKTVDWAKWYVFWADERVVAKSHADSNYKLAKDGLLSKVMNPLFGYYISGVFNGTTHNLLAWHHRYNRPTDCRLYMFDCTKVDCQQQVWCRGKTAVVPLKTPHISLLALRNTRIGIIPFPVPVVPGHVHSINDTVSAEKAAKDYEFVTRQLVRTRVINVSDTSDCPKFDLILLGMGPDGHIASLFPNHPVLEEKEEWVTFITDSPKPPPERITFTLPVINSASNVAVVVTGSSKAETVHAVIDGIDPNCPSLPAKMVRPTNGKLVWFMDKDAASKLDAANVLE